MCHLSKNDGGTRRSDTQPRKSVIQFGKRVDIKVSEWITCVDAPHQESIKSIFARFPISSQASNNWPTSASNGAILSKVGFRSERVRMNWSELFSHDVAHAFPNHLRLRLTRKSGWNMVPGIVVKVKGTNGRLLYDRDFPLCSMISSLWRIFASLASFRNRNRSDDYAKFLKIFLIHASSRLPKMKWDHWTGNLDNKSSETREITPRKWEGWGR